MNRKNQKFAKQSATINSETSSLSQKDELPGVDFKNKSGPRSLRHNKLNLNTAQGETRFLHSVSKEISQKKNVQKLQNAFRQDHTASPSAALASKQVWCTNQEISVNFSNPLDGISTPAYIQKWKNPELIQEIPRQKSYEEDQDEDGAMLDNHAKPAILAVNLKWRNGIQVKQLHKFTTRTRMVEPIMKKTDFDYETKTKFSKEVEASCEELFPEWRQTLMILDGNDSHGVFSSGSVVGGSGDSGKTGKTARSDKLQEDEPSAPYNGGSGDPHTRAWKEFTDMEEHRILVVPSHSKNGFDMDLNKHYQFPYQAKFVIGRRAYHHKFFLRLPLSKSPQHFGLIFTFSEDTKGHSKLRIKSLLTVYSICPQTPKYACLETYETAEDQSPASSPPRSRSNQATRAAKNAVQLLSDNLKEENVTACCMNTYELRRELPQAGQNNFRYQKLIDESLTGTKQKKKQQMQRNIKMEQARC